MAWRLPARAHRNRALPRRLHRTASTCLRYEESLLRPFFYTLARLCTPRTDVVLAFCRRGGCTSDQAAPSSPLKSNPRSVCCFYRLPAPSLPCTATLSCRAPPRFAAPVRVQKNRNMRLQMRAWCDYRFDLVDLIMGMLIMGSAMGVPPSPRRVWTNIRPPSSRPGPRTALRVLLPHQCRHCECKANRRRGAESSLRPPPNAAGTGCSARGGLASVPHVARWAKTVAIHDHIAKGPIHPSLLKLQAIALPPPFPVKNLFNALPSLPDSP